VQPLIRFGVAVVAVDQDAAVRSEVLNAQRFTCISIYRPHIRRKWNWGSVLQRNMMIEMVYLFGLACGESRSLSVVSVAVVCSGALSVFVCLVTFHVPSFKYVAQLGSGDYQRYGYDQTAGDKPCCSGPGQQIIESVQ